MLVLAMTMLTVRVLAQQPLDLAAVKDKIQRLEKAKDHHMLRIQSVYTLIKELDERMITRLNKLIDS
jgi:hypothetical protein